MSIIDNQLLYNGVYNTLSEEDRECLKERKWWAFLLSSVFTFLAGKRSTLSNLLLPKASLIYYFCLILYRNFYNINLPCICIFVLGCIKLRTSSCCKWQRKTTTATAATTAASRRWSTSATRLCYTRQKWQAEPSSRLRTTATTARLRMDDGSKGLGRRADIWPVNNWSHLGISD